MWWCDVESFYLFDVREYFNGVPYKNVIKILYRPLIVLEEYMNVYAQCQCIRPAYRIPLQTVLIRWIYLKIHALCSAAQPSFSFSRKWFIGGFKPRVRTHTPTTTNRHLSNYSLPLTGVASSLRKQSQLNIQNISIGYFLKFSIVFSEKVGDNKSRRI